MPGVRTLGVRRAGKGAFGMVRVDEKVSSSISASRSNFLGPDGVDNRERRNRRGLRAKDLGPERNGKPARS